MPFTDSIRDSCRKYLIILAVLLVFSDSSEAQQSDYRKIFGDDWDKATAFLSENDAWIRTALAKYNIPYDEIIAAVFPELVRYSAISDKMEITLLKALYRNIGRGYADFSVGRFQVKPSFAEKIRKIAPAVMGKKSGELFIKKSAYSNDYQFRASIIEDLEDPRKEFGYIIVFYLAAQKRFDIGNLDEKQRIRLLATAYNAGFWMKKDDLLMLEDRKFFNTKLIKTDNYSYADVALYWYEHHTPTEVK